MEKFGKLPKAKYELRINSQSYYSFVTTSIGMDECIRLMIEKAKEKPLKGGTYYEVYLVTGGEKVLLEKGKHDSRK